MRSAGLSLSWSHLHASGLQHSSFTSETVFFHFPLIPQLHRTIVHPNRAQLCGLSLQPCEKRHSFGLAPQAVSQKNNLRKHTQRQICLYTYRLRASVGLGTSPRPSPGRLRRSGRGQRSCEEDACAAAVENKGVTLTSFLRLSVDTRESATRRARPSLSAARLCCRPRGWREPESENRDCGGISGPCSSCRGKQAALKCA